VASWRPLGLSLLLLVAVALTWSAAVTGELTARWQADEAWTLQVLQRVQGGEVLYRDVFYGTTPLSMYLLQGSSALLAGGLAEVWLIRLNLGLAFLAQIGIMAWVLLRKLKIDQRLAWVAIAAAFVWLRPWPNSTYTSISFAFLFGVLAAVLQRSWIWCGVAAGLAFATKQNTGLLALAFALPLAWSDGRSRAVVRIIGVFVAVAAACLAPVWWQGAGTALLDFGFMGKSGYVQRGSMFPDWRALWPHATAEWLLQCSLLSLPFAITAPFLLRRDGNGRRLGWFAVVAAVATGPRFDLVHTLHALPACLCAFAYLASQLKEHFRLAALAPVAVATLVLGITQYGEPVRAAVRGDLVAGFLPQYGGVYVPADQAKQVREKASGLPREQNPLFLQSGRAGILYLASGLHNPLPFDYPLATAFGSHGQQKVVDYLEQNPQKCVWVGDDFEEHMAPQTIMSYVQTKLTRVTHTPGGSLRCRP
jgi:hypothetical protein